MQGASQRGRQCCATLWLFLQLSLFSEVPGFPPAHLPAATVVEAMVFAAITLATRSVVPPVSARVVTVPRQRFAWRIPQVRGPRCVGPLGRLLWAHDSQYFLSWDGHDNYVLRRLARRVRSGGNVLTTLSCLASGIFEMFEARRRGSLADASSCTISKRLGRRLFNNTREADIRHSVGFSYGRRLRRRPVAQGRAMSNGCTFSPPAIRGFDGSKRSRTSRFFTSERATTKASFRLLACRSATLKKALPK